MNLKVRRTLLAVLILGLVAASCGTAQGNRFAEMAALPASEITPPPVLDVRRTGLAGLVVGTNSRSWRSLLDSTEGRGAVVLFVEPGGPSDGLALVRGDLITSIDGQQVTNHQQALALLHTRPGQELDVRVIRPDGRERTVTIEPREPRVLSLREYLDPLIDANRDDPVLRYLRATDAASSPESRFDDLANALRLESRFVEAITLRASLLWDNRPVDETEAQPVVDEALAGWESALDIDPDNTTALAARSTAFTTLENSSEAWRDATRALRIDPNLPRAYYALGLAEREMRPERAAGPARAAVELDPFNIQYWRLLALVFMELDRREDCERTVAAFTPFLETTGFEADAADLRSACADE